MNALRLRHLLSTVLTTAGLLMLFAAPAEAHAEVRSTYPTAGSTVRGTLTQVSVRFDEAVTLVPHALRLTTDAGIPVNLESPTLSGQGRVLLARVQDRLAAGSYEVAWRVQADDGHLESSTFSFSIGAVGAGHSHGAPIRSGPPPASPGEPVWPVIVAAAIAVAGGIGAGFAVRRGLRLVLAAPIAPDRHTASPQDHDSLRLRM